MTRLQVGAGAARVQAAWGTWNDIRPQTLNRNMPLRCRIKLLDSVILPTLLWSLESLQMTTLRRRTLDGLKRRLVGRTMLVPRRATESAEAYFIRRERLISRTIDKSARGKWSALQQFKQLMFFGHCARCDPDTHIVGRNFRWRNSHWWAVSQNAFGYRTGGQLGRRGISQSAPGHCERSTTIAVATARRHPCIRRPVLPFSRTCRASRQQTGGPWRIHAKHGGCCADGQPLERRR